MSRSPFRFAALLAAGALALMTVAPVSAQTVLGTADAPRVVPVAIGAGEIEPATVEVVMGETITFAITNVSDTEVELIVGLKTDVDADSGDSLKEAENIAAGATAEVTYTFDSEGPWAYGDQIGDHYAAGAKGDVVFVDALTPAASPAPSAAPAA
jgi:plastocyanin